MAKIVTGEDQKEALKLVVSELKNLDKLKNLLHAKGTGCKITFQFSDEGRLSGKGGCWIAGDEALDLVVMLYKRKGKAVEDLMEKHHIVLEETEVALLRLAER